MVTPLPAGEGRRTSTAPPPAATVPRAPPPKQAVNKRLKPGRRARCEANTSPASVNSGRAGSEVVDGDLVVGQRHRGQLAFGPEQRQGQPAQCREHRRASQQHRHQPTARRDPERRLAPSKCPGEQKAGRGEARTADAPIQAARAPRAEAHREIAKPRASAPAPTTPAGRRPAPAAGVDLAGDREGPAGGGEHAGQQRSAGVGEAVRGLLDPRVGGGREAAAEGGGVAAAARPGSRRTSPAPGPGAGPAAGHCRCPGRGAARGDLGGGIRVISTSAPGGDGFEGEAAHWGWGGCVCARKVRRLGGDAMRGRREAQVQAMNAWRSLGT